MGNQVNKLLKLHIKYVLVSSTEDSKTLDLYQDIISYKIIKPLTKSKVTEMFLNIKIDNQTIKSDDQQNSSMINISTNDKNNIKIIESVESVDDVSFVKDQDKNQNKNEQSNSLLLIDNQTIKSDNQQNSSMINVSTNDKNNTRTKPEESENDTRNILLINVDDEMGILKMNKRIVKK